MGWAWTSTIWAWLMLDSPPACATGEHKHQVVIMRKDSLFASFGVAAALTALNCSATVLEFTPLSGSNGDPYSGHVEAGFTVTPTAGDFFEAHVFGNPTPDVYLGPIGSPSPGVLEVTDNTTGYFTFERVDLVSQNGDPSDFEFIGWLGGVNVLSGSGNVGPVGVFVTTSSPDSIQVLDLLQIVLTPSAGATSMNVDNIVVNSARAPEVPDAGHSAVLLGIGLLGLISTRLRRR